MILVGITLAYRTVSYTSIKVIAGLAPIELQLEQVNLTKKIGENNGKTNEVRNKRNEKEDNSRVAKTI